MVMSCAHSLNCLFRPKPSSKSHCTQSSVNSREEPGPRRPDPLHPSTRHPELVSLAPGLHFLLPVCVLINRSDSLEKTEGKRKRRKKKIRWLDSISNSTDTNLSNLQETVKDRGAWRAAVHGSQRVGHDLATEQQLVSWDKGLCPRYALRLCPCADSWDPKPKGTRPSGVRTRELTFPIRQRCLSAGSTLLVKPNMNALWPQVQKWTCVLSGFTTLALSDQRELHDWLRAHVAQDRSTPFRLGCFSPFTRPSLRARQQTGGVADTGYRCSGLPELQQEDHLENHGAHKLVIAEVPRQC